MQLTLRSGELVEVHPTFLYESLWNVIGLLLIFFIVSRARRFDGENTCFYFLWYGVGRFFIEGLRTDSLYLFDWQLMGQPIRVSQALSLVMIVVSLVLLFVNINKKERKPLFVDVVAAAELTAAEAAAAEVEEVSAEELTEEEAAAAEAEEVPAGELTEEEAAVEEEAGE